MRQTHIVKGNSLFTSDEEVVFFIAVSLFVIRIRKNYSTELIS